MCWFTMKAMSSQLATSTTSRPMQNKLTGQESEFSRIKQRSWKQKREIQDGCRRLSPFRTLLITQRVFALQCYRHLYTHYLTC